MISIETEQEVRRLYEGGESIREIARKLNISHPTVAAIWKMLSIVNSVPKDTIASVYDLLKIGFPVDAIVIRTKVSREIIVAIRRYHYLHNRSKGLTETCPTCKSVITKQFDTHGVHNRIIKIDSYELHESMSPFHQDMISVLIDLESLGDLGLISNQLFHDLATRTTKLLDKIQEA